MKALSIIQPWASLIAIGAKRIETRSWPTKYRGAIAIHASKGFPNDCKELCMVEPFKDELDRNYEKIGNLPKGAIIAVAHLIDCIPTDKYLRVRLPPKELAFGDFSEGRYGWVLSDVRALKTPMPCKGALGLWEIPMEIMVQVESNL